MFISRFENLERVKKKQTLRLKRMFAMFGILSSRGLYRGLLIKGLSVKRWLVSGLVISGILLNGSLVAPAYADPMRPPGFGSVSTKKEYRNTQFNLSQILISDQRKRAVINEKVLSEGDAVAGARVIKITPENVTLRVDGKRKVLKISAAKGFKIKRETE